MPSTPEVLNYDDTLTRIMIGMHILEDEIFPNPIQQVRFAEKNAAHG